MIRLITDSSSTYSIKEAKEKGFFVNPLEIIIDNKSYRDFEDITSKEIMEKIEGGVLPKTSQPNIGNLMDILEEYPDDEFIYISVADGLSGGYQLALSCKTMLDNPDRLYAINSKTLWAPQKKLVDYALKLINDGFDAKTIVKKVEELIDTSYSYLIPFDFKFLERGGRLSKTAYLVANTIKLVPIITLSKDGRNLEKFSIQRTTNKAFNLIIKALKDKGVKEDTKIFISHAFANLKDLEMIKNIVKEAFPKNKIEVFLLSPLMITHGGPRCIAVQTIKDI